ncbi:MAG: leucine-rich repeat domain-containing protein [Polyangiales bacterium]
MQRWRLDPDRRATTLAALSTLADARGGVALVGVSADGREHPIVTVEGAQVTEGEHAGPLERISLRCIVRTTHNTSKLEPCALSAEIAGGWLLVRFAGVPRLAVSVDATKPSRLPAGVEHVFIAHAKTLGSRIRTLPKTRIERVDIDLSGDPAAGQALEKHGWLTVEHGAMKALSVTGVPTLRRLELRRCRSLAALDLRRLDALEQLDITGCDAFTEQPDLSALKSLTSLTLGPGSLDEVRVADLPALRSLTLTEGVVSSVELRALPSLAELWLTRTERVRRISLDDSLAALRVVNLLCTREFTDLRQLDALPALEMLALYDCEALEDLSPLRAHPSLSDLTLHGCRRANDLSPLVDLRSLKRLTVQLNPSIERLGDIARFTSLEALGLGACENLRDLSGIEALTSLREINLSQCVALRDASALSSLPSLARVLLPRHLQ